MNTEHVEQWLQELETTDLPQITGLIAGPACGGKRGHCCLGIAEGLRLGSFTEVPEVPLAGDELAHWFGLWEDNPALDWPAELWPRASEDSNATPLHAITAAWLNDGARLTFKQIAQTIRYFGLKDRP
jgi:hypothetical protein